MEHFSKNLAIFVEFGTISLNVLTSPLSIQESDLLTHGQKKTTLLEELQLEERQTS